MPDGKTSRLPPGYRLDLVGDPCIIILRGPDGEVVARFSRDVDPEEIRPPRQKPVKKETSTPLLLKRRIESLELDACILRAETPVGPDALLVSALLPG
jgi:hypothetical protein